MYPETQPILDFTIIDTHNPLTMGIADTSVYPQGFQIVNPTLEITPPGFPKVNLPFTTNTIVMLNSNILNITCVPSTSLLASLPDGVWTVKLSVAPVLDHNTEKSFLRTVLIEQKLGKAFLKTDVTQCSMDVRIEQMKVIDEIVYYIEAAIAAANQCNTQLAINLYQTANTMLDHFLRGRCRGTVNTLWC